MKKRALELIDAALDPKTPLDQAGLLALMALRHIRDNQLITIPVPQVIKTKYAGSCFKCGASYAVGADVVWVKGHTPLCVGCA